MMNRVMLLGAPPGKPRQTQKDKWNPDDRVKIYRAWADLLRLKAFRRNRKIALEAPTVLRIAAYFQDGPQHRVGPHLVTPDVDNVAKAVMDALFLNDAMVYRVTAEKYWCDGGLPRVEIEWEP